MKLAIIGTVGVPARYGGFETLAENLVHQAERHFDPENALTVYCSAKAYPERTERYHVARLRYSRFNANGLQSVIYDAVTALDAAIRGHDRLLILGVSGAIIIPFVRLISHARIVTNVDGIEWRRDKWKGFARWFLKWSEALAVRYSHVVIADNQGIANYLNKVYEVDAEVIAYGGDHAVAAAGKAINTDLNLPEEYALALCRIEPENNVGMVLEGFALTPLMSLVFIGNWNNSEYGRSLKKQYSNIPHLHLLDPIYDVGILRTLRSKASVYVHGHSAGGTNPSLVEMMHFGVPVLAFDCVFNRYTTEGKAQYFADLEQLLAQVADAASDKTAGTGPAMKKIAQERYTWRAIGAAYFALLSE